MKIVFVAAPNLDALMARAIEVMKEEGHDVSVVDSSRENGQVLPEYLENCYAADVIVAGPGTVVPPDLVAKADNLIGLVSPVAGVDAFDVPEMTRQGLIIGHSATEEQYVSMAESTVALMLALTYRITWANRAGISGWDDGINRPARTLDGKTVGLVGYGRIAERVAQRLQGWNCNILVATRRKIEALPEYMTQLSLDEVLGQSDFILPLMRLVPETQKWLGRKEIGQIKPGAMIINTARGALIDEEAMIEALDSGHLGGAALDVFDAEPLPDDSPLRKMENVILTPHMVGHTQELRASLGVALIENLRHLAKKEPPAIYYNAEVLPDWQEKLASLSQ